MKETPIAAYNVRAAGRQGAGSLLVYLPPMWVREVGLKPKEEVIVTRVAGESCIRIYPPGKYKLDGKK